MLNLLMCAFIVIIGTLMNLNAFNRYQCNCSFPFYNVIGQLKWTNQMLFQAIAFNLCIAVAWLINHCIIRVKIIDSCYSLSTSLYFFIKSPAKFIITF